MLKRNILLPALCTCLCACHHATLEDRAEKYTKDYTERFCPTPVQDMQRTDSLTFDRTTRTFNYYFTLVDKADNADIIKTKQKEITDALLKQLKKIPPQRFTKTKDLTSITFSGLQAKGIFFSKTRLHADNIRNKFYLLYGMIGKSKNHHHGTPVV